MEMLVEQARFSWSGRRVFLTGHTGFKGSWLALWLHQLGAEVHGYALDPPTEPALFHAASVAGTLASDTRADLAERAGLRAAIARAAPEIIFHLAAQPLVRASYEDPVGTFATNVLGTAHLLDAARDLASLRAIVVVTTDKVYENREWVHPYREEDRLGGHDPYSASKAAAEIITASMRSSFFQSGARIATARAGNVIGGGDWAADRLVPDCLRAFSSGEPVRLRFPGALRPWQHVLEPLDGYLSLASALCAEDGARFAKAWNFGPDPAGNGSVGAVADALARLWGEDANVIHEASSSNPHEAGLLTLDNSAAHHHLGWRPRWDLPAALARTVEWHRAWMEGDDAGAISLQQIDRYQSSRLQA